MSIRERLARAATALALVTLLTATAATSAAAAEDTPTSWSVKPANAAGADGRVTVTHKTDPGDVVQEFLEISNFGEQDVEFTLAAADGYFTDNDRFNMLTKQQQSVDAGTWATIAPSVTVPAGGSTVVPYDIQVPADATPGDHLLGVAASILSTDTRADGEQIGVEARVGIPITLRVTGTWNTALSSELAATFHSEPNPFSPGKTDVTVTIANEGNSIVAVAGALHTAGPFGVSATQTEIPPIGRLAPGESRTLPIAIPEIWPTFLTTLTLTTTATPPAESTAPTADSVKTATVLSLPWSQLVVLGVAALLITLWVLDRRRQRLRLQQAVSDAVAATSAIDIGAEGAAQRR